MSRGSVAAGIMVFLAAFCIAFGLIISHITEHPSVTPAPSNRCFPDGTAVVTDDAFFGCSDSHHFSPVRT